MISLVSVLKSIDKANVFESVLKCLCVSVKICFEQASKNYLLVLEKVRSFPPILLKVLSYY